MTLSEHSKMHASNRKMEEKTKNKLREISKNRPSYNRNKTEKDIMQIVIKYKELQKYRKVDNFFGFANGTTGNIIRGKNYKEFKQKIDDFLKM
jgi:hypothetical protein